MSSRNVLLADAIVAHLNGAPSGTFVLPFESRSVVNPYHEMERATDLSVIVGFGGFGSGPFTRGQRLYTLSPFIFISRPIAPPADPELPYERTAQFDQLIQLSEEIVVYFPPYQVLGSNEAKVLNASIETIFDPDEIQNKRRYLSAIRLECLTT